MERYAEPLKHFYGTAREFLESSDVSSVVNHGRYNGSGPLKYRGNLILIGEPDLIRAATEELYDDVFKRLATKYGREGYDETERLDKLIREVGIAHPDSDHDGGLAFDPNYKLLGTGRFVKNRGMREWKYSPERMLSETIKGDKVGGKHMAGWLFSRKREPFKDGGASMVLSENGRSIITYRNGDLVPDYSSSLSKPSPSDSNDNVLYMFPPRSGIPKDFAAPAHELPVVSAGHC